MGRKELNQTNKQINELGKSDKMRGSVEANNMDPDQTAPMREVWSEFILFAI